MFKISKTNRWAGSCGWSCVLNLHGRPMTTANIFLQFLARADNEKNTLKTSDVWQTDKCDIRIKNISTVWAWKVTWRGFKCAEKDRKFEIGRILDLDWKALRWEFISTLTQKRKCDITQKTEKEKKKHSHEEDLVTCAQTGISIVPIGMFAGSKIWRPSVYTHLHFVPPYSYWSPMCPGWNLQDGHESHCRRIW